MKGKYLDAINIHYSVILGIILAISIKMGERPNNNFYLVVNIKDNIAYYSLIVYFIMDWLTNNVVISRYGLYDRKYGVVYIFAQALWIIFLGYLILQVGGITYNGQGNSSVVYIFYCLCIYFFIAALYDLVLNYGIEKKRELHADVVAMLRVSFAVILLLLCAYDMSGAMSRVLPGVSIADLWVYREENIYGIKYNTLYIIILSYTFSKFVRLFAYK